MLTDVLTCPRCGPGHGLILLPEAVRDRRVISGFLGCPDCRARYAVVEGIADLTVGEAVAPVTLAAAESAGGGAGADEAAVRLAGILGLEAGTGVVLLAGPAAAHAASLAALVEGMEVVATTDRAPVGASAARLGDALPFQSGRLRGVALTGAATRLLEEGARVLMPAGRLLLDPAPADARARLESAGLRALAEQDGALVAARV